MSVFHCKLPEQPLPAGQRKKWGYLPQVLPSSFSSISSTVCPYIHNQNIYQELQRLCFCKYFMNPASKDFYFSNFARRGKISLKSKTDVISLLHFPIRKPFTSAQNTVPSFTPSKCHSPKNANDKMTPTRQLMQS